MDRAAALQFHAQALSALRDPSKPENHGLAYQLFASSVLADPTFASGWYAVGDACMASKMLPAAAATCRRALELPLGTAEGDLTPATRARLLCNLGHRLHHMGRAAEARIVTQQAIEADPQLAFAHTNMSLIEAEDGFLDEAMHAADRGHALDPDNATIETALAFALLFKGYYAAGLRHFGARFRYRLHAFNQYPYPEWAGERHARVFLVADQGIGDTLSFARFLPAAAALAGKHGQLTVGVQPELMRVMRDTFAQLTNVGFIALPCQFPPAECWSTFVSLPVALRLSDDEIATAELSWHRYRAPAPWRVPGRTLHVGIAWGGSTGNDIDKHRSIPLELFLELYRVPGIQLYSLQVDARGDELHAQGCGALVVDLKPYIRDVADTLAVLEHLDLVITCESALGHIAGAAGMPCWVPYSWRGRDWRIGWDGSKPLWYPRHRVFKQGPEAAWPPVFERMVGALLERAGRASARPSHDRHAVGEAAE